METTTVRLYSLSARQSKTWLAAATLIAGNIALPQLCHLIPNGGHILLPVYFFTLLGAYKYGWRVGLLTAILSPLINTALFGMPSATALPVILCKSTAAALAASYAAARTGKITIISMACTVAAYQAAGTLFEWAWTGSFDAAMQDVRTGALGLAIQIVGVWAVIRYMFKN